MTNGCLFVKITAKKQNFGIVGRSRSTPKSMGVRTYISSASPRVKSLAALASSLGGCSKRGLPPVLPEQGSLTYLSRCPATSRTISPTTTSLWSPIAPGSSSWPLSTPAKESLGCQPRKVRVVGQAAKQSRVVGFMLVYVHLLVLVVGITSHFFSHFQDDLASSRAGMSRVQALQPENHGSRQFYSVWSVDTDSTSWSYPNF